MPGGEGMIKLQEAGHGLLSQCRGQDQHEVQNIGQAHAYRPGGATYLANKISQYLLGKIKYLHELSC